MMIVDVEIAFSFKRELPERSPQIVLTDGADARTALETLARDYPAVRGRLFDGRGGLRREISILVNGANVHRRQGLATKLRTGDRLTILPPVGGG